MTLPSELLREVCSTIIDTGFPGSADEYVLKYYHKPFKELTQNESEPPFPYLEWQPKAVMKILKKVFGNVDTIYREHHPILGEYWYVKSNKESE